MLMGPDLASTSDMLYWDAFPDLRLRLVEKEDGSTSHESCSIGFACGIFLRKGGDSPVY